jgi:hypothetical protein
MEMKKLITIGIIFLFIGVAVAPSLNSAVVKTSDDLVEVTSQACGIQGFGNTTVKLTKEQYQSLEQYLVDFRARLNQTTTREEAVPLFKDAVVELNKYGLLPRGMSVEKAQKLVIGQEKENHRLHGTPSKINLTNYNFLCFVTGSVKTMGVWSQLGSLIDSKIALPFLLILLFSLYLYYKSGNKLAYLATIISGIIYASIIGVWWLFEAFINLIPISILFSVYFNKNATGWVDSVGLLGSKSWNGTLAGTMHDRNNFWWAMNGFTGLKIFTGLDKPDFLLGTALAVGIQKT